MQVCEISKSLRVCLFQANTFAAHHFRPFPFTRPFKHLESVGFRVDFRLVLQAVLGLALGAIVALLRGFRAEVAGRDDFERPLLLLLVVVKSSIQRRRERSRRTDSRKGMVLEAVPVRGHVRGPIGLVVVERVLLLMVVAGHAVRIVGIRIGLLILVVVGVVGRILEGWLVLLTHGHGHAEDDNSRQGNHLELPSEHSK